MARNTRLTDFQRILLSHAGKRDDGHVLPLPPAAAADPERAERDLQSLLRRELLIETSVDDAASTWRIDDNEQRVGLTLSAKGRDAVGLDTTTDEIAAEEENTAPAEPAVVASPPSPVRPSKQALVVGLLQREEGATLAEMMAATGWLAHSTRAVLTGLRKKGHELERGKRGDVTCYRIVGAA